MSILIIGVLNFVTSLYFRRNRYGAVAQLGERVVRNDEVVGSIPISSKVYI